MSRVYNIDVIWILYLLTAAFVFAQPKEAFVVERAPIPASIHPNRELVLWMLNPVKHERGIEGVYTCPEVTTGSYFSGRTRISLVDTMTSAVINTVKLSYRDERDTFDVPYRIIAGRYYLVPGHGDDSEGKPKLLALRDFNGDGRALETAFYEAEACMGLPTTLIGYSVKQDRVIQYLAELHQAGQTTLAQSWTDYLFAEKRNAAGEWKYEIDYSGRGGCDMNYTFRYDADRERFVGELKVGICADDPPSHKPLRP